MGEGEALYAQKISSVLCVWSSIPLDISRADTYTLVV